MGFLHVTLTLLLTIYTSDGVNIVQEPKISFVLQKSSVTLHCTQDKTDHQRMSWYRKSGEKQDLELLAYSAASNSQKIEPPFDKADKYTMTRPEVLKGTLQIDNLEAADSALYFCATNGNNYPAYFGAGTKLTVLGKKVFVLKIIKLTKAYFGGEQTKTKQILKNAQKQAGLSCSIAHAIQSCAYGNSQAYFGEGTKLTVLDAKVKQENIKEPKVNVLNHSKSEECWKKKVTLVCVAEDFYPDHVSVFWQIDKENVTTGVATDNKATPNKDNTSYHITSRLSVPFKKWIKGSIFSCNVTFQKPIIKEDGTIEKTETVYTWDTINAIKRIDGADNAEIFLKSGRVTMLAYGMFIAKSFLYCLFILVIMRRQGFISK
ncbi:M1-specific T cell receptor beta chain-like [Salminus brasiliensis]|uniref:M1-specific T cell receptor beta chain-like n=1 Tax=Salminus brasiliensis TaxID=930266 RepID=UPI003B82E7F1